MSAILGRPVTIIEFLQNNNLEVHEDALCPILFNERVIFRKVVVVSIAGLFRKGKSFLMNYFLRYLYAHYPSINSPSQPSRYRSLFCNWMSNDDENLTGFSWSSGVERDTAGIVFWSDVFLHDASNGDKLAIILMDTQGLGALENIAVEPERIFATSLLISSMQIYNLMGIVEEDHLKFLQRAVETAETMSNGNQSYQYLMLLVRDWIFSDDFACGFEGGNMYLSKIIGIKDNNNPSLTDLRQFILHSFQDLDCFLLQNPGTISKGGIWKGFSREFKNNLSVLSSFLLAPGSLIVKQNNGKPLVASDLHKLICDLMVAPRPETFEEENFEYLILQDLDDTSGVAANAVPFDCPVCLDFKQIGEGITLRECLHSFCKECLRGTIIHSEDARVKCPFSNNDFNCDIYLQSREIRSLVSEEQLEKHFARGLQIAEAVLTTFHCKTPNCPGFCEVEGNVKNFVCNVCWKNNCIECKMIHGDITCDEYKTRARANVEEDETSKVLADQIARGVVMKCPGCQIPLARVAGCDFLTCFVCKMEICWITKKPRRGPNGCNCQPTKKCHPQCGNCH